MKPGDWLCPSCHCHNFASRTSCFRCNAPGMNYDGVRVSPGPDAMGGMHNQQMGGYSAAQYPHPRSSQHRPGDWICPKPSCKFQNFASRNECMRCGQRRMGGGQGLSGGMPSGMGRPMMGSVPQGGGISTRVLPGDWICSNCNINNFASRTRCLQCGSPNVRISRPADRAGDWNCPNENCRYHNFASRGECYRCGTRKVPGMGVPSLFPMYNSGSGMMGGNGGGGEAPSDYVRNSDTSCSNSFKMKPGDWVCREGGCGFFNFARRETCAQCGAPANPIAEGPPGVPPESVNDSFSTFMNCGKYPSQQLSPSTAHPQMPSDSISKD